MNISVLKTKVFLVLTAVFISVLFAGSINAQSGTATINGTVTDLTGAAVPGATVRLTNPATGLSRTVVTNQQGGYSFPSIQPATYRIEVEAGNFKKAVKSDIQALVDTTNETNFTLEPGDVSAVVDVTTDDIKSVVNTQDASLGNNFVPQQITQLPTDSRNIPDLLSLQPGVTKEGYVAGGRSDQANITLDGIDVNDQQTGAAFSPVLRITSESIEEFRITTTNANASQGRSSGAQISLITKRGTNNFNGSLFFFHRPDRFSANNFFNNAAGVYSATDFAVINGSARAGEEKVPRPNLRRNIYGGSLGGPIVKDKFFFFYSYEGFRERQDVSVVRTVPTASLAMGQLKFFGATAANPTTRLITLTTAELNSIYSEVGINPAAVAIFAGAASRYPVNDDSVGDGLNVGGFRFNAAAPIDLNTHILRLDWNINSSQTFSARGNYQQDEFTRASYFPDTYSPKTWSHPTGIAFNHIWTISNNKVNNLRYGLTRQAFTAEGDSNDNFISFRFVYQPAAFSRKLSRVTPIHNITDDFTWIKGNHTMQFGGNIRLITNRREDLGSSFDSAVANPSFYNLSGRVLDLAVSDAGYTFARSQRSIIQNAASALIGRFSQYTGQFNYDLAGNVLPPGTLIEREFATQEYDIYGQDTWKITRNLTLTYGLRYALSRPVYEKNGYQVAPSERLGDFFERRKQSAATGVPLNDLIQFELAGPSYDKPGFYSMDWNNVQPSVAVAWSPNFKNKFLRTVFGGENEGVIRGGFRITNDYFGQQLAVTFDGLSSLGFTTSDTIAANTYDIIGCNQGGCPPRFMGFGQSIRTLPNISAPNRFLTPADEDQRIESSLDATLVSPTHYTWNVTYGRELPKGMFFEASYIGRAARNLLATRDIMALNNLVDPATGMDWYTAAGMLHDFRARDTPITSVPAIAYFENLFPNARAALSVFGLPANNNTQAIYGLVARDGFDILDWTFVQLIIDDATAFGLPSNPGRFPNMFFHPQYAAFSAFSTVAKSNYHGGSFTLRQRLGRTLSFDVNYTFSKSMDNASGLQTSGTYGSAFILNPLRPDDNYAVSDFDSRHVLNANFLFQLPFGKGRKFFSDMHPVANAILGGWQLSGVYRFNSGLPAQTPFDAAQWATNWNVQSNGVRIRQIEAQINRNTQNLFADPQAAYNSFRNARPGETGDRNVLRESMFSVTDLGLGKSFNMPWNENHKLELRWEVFNVFNEQYFQITNITRSTLGLGQDSDTGDVDPNFGEVFTDIQGQPRRMQFGLRFVF